MKTLLTFLLLISSCNSEECYITYSFSGGRFGDNLLTYCHAKWISYQFDIPLLYTPFQYSSKLALDQFEIPYQKSYNSLMKKVFFKENLMKPQGKKPILYVIPYFPECDFELADGKYPFSCKVDWKDQQFRHHLREAIQPKERLALTHPPKHTINIAIHFREGGGADPTDREKAFPLKFPPFAFYIEGLLKIIPLFPGKAFYCHLFTDTLNPGEYMEKLKQAVPPGTNISFNCRLANNSQSQNVLEDFFSLFLFDVLIHPQSNFSLIPSLIHDYAVVYAPLSARLQEGKYVIDQVKFEISPCHF